MKGIVDRAASVRQSVSPAHPAPKGAAETDLADSMRAAETALATSRAVLRASIDECGYTSLEGLAVAMRRPPIYGDYISKVLTGDKPLSYTFIVSLPDDVRAEFHARETEQLGRLVVPVVAQGRDAALQFVAGLFGMLGLAALPAKSGGQLKADLSSTAADQARRLA